MAPREAVKAVREALRGHWMLTRGNDGGILCGNDACNGWMTRAEFSEHVAVAAADAAVAALAGHVAELEAAIDRVRRRHPRGDEETGPLAPGLWCPGCGQERTRNGTGGCPERNALSEAQP